MAANDEFAGSGHLLEGDPDEEVGRSNGAVSPPQSYIEEIKTLRRQLSEERILDLAIPGYNGLLVARYHYVDGMYDELKKIIDRVESSKNPRKELNGQIDVLVLACKEVLVKVPADNEYADERGLAPIDPERPTAFDSHLAEILDIDAKRAREVVYAVFQNSLSIAMQHNELMEWAASNQQEIDADTEGESESTPQSG